jgi:hypothetical protein
MMPAMTSLSWFPAAVTYLSPPCDFPTRSQRVRRGNSSDTRHDSNPPMPAQKWEAADVLATHRASNLSLGCASPVVVMV